MSRSATRALAAAISSVSLVGIGLSLSITLIALDLAAMGFDAESIGLNVAVAGLATLVGAPFVPAAARRFGTKRTLLAALLISVFCLAAFPVRRDYTTWLALRALYSLALTTLFILSEYWINAVTPARRRGFVFGLYGASLAGGFSVGPALLTLTGGNGDRAFGFAIALFVLATVPILFGGGVPNVPPSRASGSGWPRLMAAPLPLLAACLHGALETSGLGLLAVAALKAGTSPATAAGLVGLFAAGNIVCQIPIGLLSDRMDRERLLLGLGAIGCAGAILLACLPVGTLAFGIALFAWGGLIGSFYAVGLTQIGAQYAGADLAGVNAAFVTFYAAGMLAGPPIVGAALQVHPATGFFESTGGLLGLFAVVALVIVSRRRSPRP